MYSVLRSLRRLASSSPSRERFIQELNQLGTGEVRLTLCEDGIATLVISNPQKRNALSGKMMIELNEAINKLELWMSGKAVLIYGANNNGFCSGGDLQVMKKVATVEEGIILSNFMTAALKKLSNMPLISLAFIQAPGAFGGGAEVSIACDIRLMTPDAKIGFIHSKLGIIPAWGGTSFLLDKVNRSTALTLVASGRILNTEEAIKVGLVEGVVSDIEEARTFLKSIVCSKSDVVRTAKEAIIAGNDTELQGRLFAKLFGADFYKAAVTEILEHKK